MTTFHLFDKQLRLPNRFELKSVQKIIKEVDLYVIFWQKFMRSHAFTALNFYSKIVRI